MRYLLNSAVITGPGTYTYRLVQRAEAVAWLRAGEFISRIGYPATASHIAEISDIMPELSRESTVLLPGDEALVVRLKYRVQDPAQKACLQPSDDDWEYGFLVRKE